MKDTITTNEFVYFTGTEECKRDFSGKESALSVEERLDFLKHYADAASRWNNDIDINQKTVSEREIEEFSKKVACAKDLTQTKYRRVITFERMMAYEAYKEPEYKGLHLYCGAKLQNDEIVFPARKIRPTPCALLEIGPKENIRVSFEIFIPKSYKCTQNTKCGVAQAGRVIELRAGTLDKVKVKLYNTGEIFAFQGKMWAPSDVLLGYVRFDGWNSFLIDVKDEKMAITVNEKTTNGLSCNVDGKIDSIFFDGGMFPRDEWRIRNVTVGNEKVEYEKNNRKENNLTDGKEVDLPYAIGGAGKRDRRLYLTKTFEVESFENAILEIRTLEPYGKAWLNGELVLDTDTFTRNCIEVTKYLKKGINELKILVEPRPPEVYYFWHRHTDCYNGWYCGEVSLILTGKNRIEYMRVKTNSVKPLVKGMADIELNNHLRGMVCLYARECYPGEGAEFLLGKNEINGKRCLVEFEGNLKVWDTENPVLYSVRAELRDENGTVVDDYAQETGFRTICQKNGGIYLNGERILLNGALLMQFLPPFDEVPVNHVCPSVEQLVMQSLMLKKMNGNLLRLHLLGYGTNDPRYARVCDRLGIMLAWTTRFIDSLEELVWDDGMWREQEAYVNQVKEVINHPSIIMYEGSNEYHAMDIEVIDRMYDYFVDVIKDVDDSRLLSPCSHLYYGGGIYELGCRYYNDDGTKDQDGGLAMSSHGWRDESVVRSSHTYCLLCGYGTTWEEMRKQDWKWQPELLESKRHSYLITEFAITALANPNTKEAMSNPYIESYERDNEIGVIGRHFRLDEWRESQAFQALCAQTAVKHMRVLGVDGMAWCCLSSGANNGSYMKPPIDFYGYKKLGFYALAASYRPVYATKMELDVCYAKDSKVTPVILRTGQKGIYELVVSVISEKGEVVDKAKYSDISLDADGNIILAPFVPKWERQGYYTLRFDLARVG